jgi:two-component system sensor histidine kinase AlgZ
VALLVVAAWTLVALAWIPATILVTAHAGGPQVPWWFSALVVFAAFVPWMAATPLILWLGRRFPVIAPRAASGLAVQAVAALVLIPLLGLLGAVIGRTALAMVYTGGDLAWAATLQAGVIDALYSVPTYIAVVGVGQAIAWFELYRVRDRLLAGAQLRALRAQINPHFLFNALNGVSALGYRDPAMADQALARLSELLRSALVERPQEIPLRDEIAFLGQYLDLQALLTSGGVAAAWDVEADAWDAAVPSMLLQPLVENAVVHGLARRRGGGLLRLSAHRVGDVLTLELVNDGPDDDAARASEGAGLGLSNVRERLRALYSERQSLTFERAGDGRAAVRVTLPFRRLPTEGAAP